MSSQCLVVEASFLNLTHEQTRHWWMCIWLPEKK